MRLIRTVLLLAAALTLVQFSAWAGPVTAGIWWEFYWDSGTGAAAVNVATAGCSTSPFCPITPPDDITFTDPPPWTFSTPAGTRFTVTDVSMAGDQFDVFDFGGLILTTSAVAANGYICGKTDTDYVDPSVCLPDNNMSHGSVLLAAGKHSITITAKNAPFGDGVADFRFAPEPGFSLVTGAIVLGFAGLRRYRRSKRSEG